MKITKKTQKRIDFIKNEINYLENISAQTFSLGLNEAGIRRLHKLKKELKQYETN